MTVNGNRFDRALYVALVAHSGSVDKNGDAYIKHALRVAMNFTEEPLQVVALLHDTVEDAGFELEFIEREFGYRVAIAVGLLTRRKGNSYNTYILGLKGHLLAEPVKIADLRDHLREPSPLTEVQKARYREALELLGRH